MARGTKAQGYVAAAVLAGALLALLVLYRRDVRRCGRYEFATESQPSVWIQDINDRKVERPWYYGKDCHDAYRPEWDTGGAEVRDVPPFSAEQCWRSAKAKGIGHRVCLEGTDNKTLFCVQPPNDAKGLNGFNWRRVLGQDFESKANLSDNSDPCPPSTYGKHTKYNAANDTCCVTWSKEPQFCVHRGLCAQRAPGKPARGNMDFNRGYCCTKTDSWDCQTAKGSVIWPNCTDDMKTKGFKYWGWGKTDGLCCKTPSTQDRANCEAPWATTAPM